MKIMNTRSSLLYLLVQAWIIGVPLSSPAANMVVNNRNDGGAGSLRGAVTTANANPDADVITFDPALAGQGIALSTQIVLSNHVTIDASGLAGGIFIFNNGTPTARLFEVAGNAVVELNHLTMLGGRTTTTATDGGAIWVNAASASGALTLNHCTLAHNIACEYGRGGAIAVDATDFAATLNHCTVAHNAAFDGGGISQGGGRLTVNNCTFSHNMAIDKGGAIRASATVTVNGSSIHNNYAQGQANGGGGIFAGTVIANNSTIVNNRAGSFGGGVVGQSLLTNCTISGNVAFNGRGGITSSGSSSAWVNTIVAGNSAPTFANFQSPAPVVSNSLTNGDPQLAPLGDYGGPTPTMPPLAGSPAIDAGDDSVTNSLAADQRGYPRLGGAHVDIGAVERQMVSTTNAPVLKLTFTSSPDTDFTVLNATNAALPTDQWSILGPPTQNPPGQYQFTDILALDYPQRFYKVTSP
jgi:fibronectin-binding autotransporter adhesin